MTTASTLISVVCSLSFHRAHTRAAIDTSVPSSWVVLGCMIIIPRFLQNILRTVNASGTKLGTLTVGSSHTAGAGVGTFLMGHPTLTV